MKNKEYEAFIKLLKVENTHACNTSPLGQQYKPRLTLSVFLRVELSSLTT